MTQETLADGKLIVEKIGTVLRVTFNNPAKKNAFTNEMYMGVAAILNDHANDSSVRVVWLRGAEGNFTSGNDVTSFRVIGDDGVPPSQHMIRAFVDFPKPIVAEVETLAVGIGATMLLHCDIIYAADGTRFRFPFVNLGVVPEAGSSYLLPRLVGAPKAAELILLGRFFDAKEADEMGLITRALPREELSAAAENAATALSKQPPASVRKSRALLRKMSTDVLHERVDEEFDDLLACAQGPECMEAIMAFIEKREPDFSRFE